MINSIVKCFRECTNFKSRASRKEYWSFYLFNFVVALLLGFLAGLLKMEWLLYVYGLVVLLPTISVSVRRLHDLGETGWWYLVNLVPFVGGLLFFIWMAFKGQPGENKWGKNPVEA